MPTPVSLGQRNITTSSIRPPLS
ncbi:hypothetical protein D021_0854A, partial [Vibrio parahaemolyticus 10296]